MSVLLPWLPSPSNVRKLFATKEIYDIISQSIVARRQSAVATDDTLQMLLDNKDDDMTIIGVMILAVLLEAPPADTPCLCSLLWAFLLQVLGLLERQASFLPSPRVAVPNNRICSLYSVLDVYIPWWAS